MNSQQDVPVLVIDDDRDQYELVKAILELEGYTVVTAGSAEAGLQMYERHHPFLVISDFSMPDMDGADLIKQLHSGSARGRVPAPVVILSANSADYVSRRMYKDFPPDLILPKPVDFDRLLAVVEAYQRQYCQFWQYCAA